MHPPVSFAIDRDSGIATIVFDRPEVLNAIDLPMAKAFRAAVAEVTADAAVRCIVLTGAGRAFMAGGDIGGFAADLDKAGAAVDILLEEVHPAILALRSVPAPVLAVVRGAAAGAGLSLVLGADVVVAAESASFVLAYDRLGVTPDCGGTWFLERKIGRTQAFALMLTGARLRAAEAHARGLITEVVDDDRLEARGHELAESIARGPTLAFGRYKALIDEAPVRSLAEQLEAERRAFIAATHTEDFAEGVRAFAAKRPPAFQGR